MKKVLINGLLAFLVVVCVNAVLFSLVVMSGPFDEEVNANWGGAMEPVTPKEWIYFFVIGLPYFLVGPGTLFWIFLSWRDSVRWQWISAWIALLLALIIDVVIMRMLFMVVWVAMFVT